MLDVILVDVVDVHIPYLLFCEALPLSNLNFQSASADIRHTTKDKDLSPTEEKIQEINANLVRKMNGLGLLETPHLYHPHQLGTDNKLLNNRTGETTSNVASTNDTFVTKSKYTDVRYDDAFAAESANSQKPRGKTRPNNNSQNSKQQFSQQQQQQHHNGDSSSGSRRSKTRQVVEVGGGPSASEGGGGRGRASTTHRKQKTNVDGDCVELQISNIANSCLEVSSLCHFKMLGNVCATIFVIFFVRK